MPNPTQEQNDMCVYYVDPATGMCDDSPATTTAKPSSTPASDHRECSTLNKPTGCINPTPDEIADAKQICINLRVDPTEDGVEGVTNAQLDKYGRDGITALERYATLATCPDMAGPIAAEFNARMQRRGETTDWDTMWKVP